MNGRGLSNKACRESLPKETKAVLYISRSFYIARLVWKLGTRQSASMYRGEWVYRTRSEVFKDKARLQLQTTL